MHAFNTVALWVGWFNIGLWSFIWVATVRKIHRNHKGKTHA